MYFLDEIILVLIGAQSLFKHCRPIEAESDRFEESCLSISILPADEDDIIRDITAYSRFLSGAVGLKIQQR